MNFFVFLSTDSIICIMCRSNSIDFLLIMSWIFLLVFMPGNFIFDTRHYKCYVLRCCFFFKSFKFLKSCLGVKLRYLKRVWSFQALLRFPSLSKTETSFDLRLMYRSAKAITSWVFYPVCPVSWGFSNLAVGMWTSPTLMWALVNIPSTCSFSMFSSSSLG